MNCKKTRHTNENTHLAVCFSETIKFTRLETRTKESHLYARIRANKHSDPERK